MCEYQEKTLPGTLGSGLVCDSKVVFIKAFRRLSRSLSKLGHCRAVKKHNQQKESNQSRNKREPKGVTRTTGLEQLAPLDAVLFKHTLLELL